MGFINQFPYSDFHELNLDWLLSTTKDLKEKIQYLMEEFAKIEIMTEDQINAMIHQAITTNNIDLYNRMNQLKTDITLEYKDYVDSSINLFKVYVDNQDVHYDELASNYALNAINVSEAYTDTKLVDYTYMINPITGEYDDVRNVVNDIVEYFHTDNTLTAGEYDALDLTAQAYDNYELSAFDYDFNGKILLI